MDQRLCPANKFPIGHGRRQARFFIHVMANSGARDATGAL
jgi:hypothetical protein